ncbi:tetratricopeptide repeat protein [Acaryochloris thomasi]
MHTVKAKELLKANDVGVLYKEMVAELAEGQYQTLDHVQAVVEQLSELNLAYLIRQESMASAPQQKFATSQTVQTSAPEPVPQPPPSSPKTAVTSPQAAPAPSKPPVDSFVSQYVRRAEELMAKNRFQQAIQELRDGLKLDPKNSQCQSLLGSIYLKQKQTKMAKIHFRQALKLEPGDIDALKGMEKIAKLEKAAQGTSSQSAQQASGRKGLFGLFGGKK